MSITGRAQESISRASREADPKQQCSSVDPDTLALSPLEAGGQARKRKMGNTKGGLQRNGPSLGESD